MSTVLEPKSNESKPAAIPESKKESKAASPSSREWKTTYRYLGGAFLFLAVTGGLEWANRPAPIKEFGRVGEEFYEDFVDPTLATSLEVFTFDADTVKPKEFRVERLDNGRWVIPSHHNYPADAEEQLAKTASSVIGISRGAMVTRWSSDHARYGVVNPKQDSLTVDQVDGVGQRLILRGEDESVLVDYIVGKKVEGEYDQFHVRHPNEEEVYIAKLDVDLSTRFTDWIDTDLFDISSGDVLNLTVNDYSFDELSGKLTEREVTELTREKTWSDDWKLKSLGDEEELNKDAIRDTLTAISELEIAGVRAKQQGLTPDLMLDKNVLSSQRDVDRLQSDLLARGFVLQSDEEKDQLNLIAREGELYAGTNDGLVYRMHFGRVFTGNQEELEVGFAASSEPDEGSARESSDDVEAASEGDGSKDDSSADSTEKDEVEQEVNGKPGRYVFVRVDFDQQLLGEQPIKPTEPEKPAELVEAENQKTASDEEAAESSGESVESEGVESNSDSGDDQEATAEGAEEEADSKVDRLEELRKDYEEAKSKYDDDLKKFEEYQDKIKDGKEKAAELNRRFAEWYYVIPGESYDKLSLARADLVKPKKAGDEDQESDSSNDETASTNQNAGSVEP